MNDKKKTKAQLLDELSELRRHEETFRVLVEHGPDLLARFDR